MNRERQVVKYLVFDFIAAALSWALFYLYRKTEIEPQRFGDVPVELTQNFYLGLFIIPLFWLLLYYLSGFYNSIYRRSRLLELGKTLLITIIGVSVIFFVLILDDLIDSYKNYYQLYFTLLTLHFTFTYLFRLILTSSTVRKINRKEIGFNTIIVGSNKKALKAYNDIENQKKPSGNIFVGYVPVFNSNNNCLNGTLPNLGKIENIKQIIEENNIEEVIIAIETTEHRELSKILTVIEHLNLKIWGIPDLYDFLSGSVKMSSIYGTPLIKIANGIMPEWQENFKRMIDVIFSAIAIIIFFPVFIVLAIIIKATSPGPIFYKQERIGRFGNPFYIYKLRSMVKNAETNQPLLSKDQDSRITKIGMFLRKTHLDEIPQFVNVIIGDMSLVGPRPERAYYIEKIIKHAPHYTLLHKIRPGITSWGQVKYGYASNVDEMLERLPYDILYLKNCSLYIDFKIIIYTIIVSFSGKGK